jgi:uncharacterized membrane protein YeaQ/YmgE (transglycosylase-associated protein family)
MGITAWIAASMAAGLLANMLLPGKRSRGLIFICLVCFTGALGGGWAASLFRLDGFFSFSSWLAAITEAAVLLLACHLLTRQSGRPSLVEIGVHKNTTVVFPAPLTTTIAKLGSFLAREQAAASAPPLTTAGHIPPPAAAANGSAVS